MINGFKIKEMSAFIVPQFITVVGFMIMLYMYGMFIASMAAVLFIVLSTFIGKLMIKNPFMEMMKGNGILTIPIDSRGWMKPFLCKFHKGMIVGEFDGKPVKAPFDRKIVFNIEEPRDMKMLKDKEGNIFMRITPDEFSENRFSMMNFPVLLYNSQMGGFITKDWLSERETDTFSRHHIIHANKIAERLTEQITNFGRYIADNAMSKMKSVMQSPIVKIVFWGFIIFAVGFMLVKFGPQLLGSFEGAVKP